MATIAAALIAAGGTYYATRQANKRSGQDRQMSELLAKNSELAGEYGRDFLGKSRNALGPVYDYYRALASGDRNSVMQYLGPEFEAQSDGARRAFQTSSELSPRSGTAVEANSRIPMDNAAAIARILRGARPAGIEGLATLGTNWGSLGMSGLSQSGSGAGQLLGYNTGRRNEARQAGMDAGDSAYAIFKLISEAANSNRGQNQNGSLPAYSNSFWNVSQNAPGTGR
jgi:hypothetical protein